MEGEHAQMWQIPCKMTNSSSKPLQTLGKWYQPRNPKKIPKPAQKKNPKTISHPFCGYRQIDSRARLLQFIFLLRLNVCNDLAEAMKALDGKKIKSG